MADTLDVTYINNSMRGAPVLNGQPGSLIAVLDAFLLTGFGLTTAVSVSVSDGIATATLQSGQSFEPYSIVLVEGATPAALNGRARVLTASNASITWATAAPNGVAGGTITIKTAPAVGWEKAFSGTNKAVYRSTDQGGSRFYYRIDDSGTTTARVRGFETMTDVDAGGGLFPTDAQIAGGGWWGKSVGANANAVIYDLAADSRFILAMLAVQTASNAAQRAAPARGFGDLAALVPADAYAAAVAVSSNTSEATAYAYGGFDRSHGSTSGPFCARPFNALGGSQKAALKPLVGGATQLSGSDDFLGAFPSYVDGELKYSRKLVFAGLAASDPPRAWVPGVLHIPQSGVVGAGVGARDVIVGSGSMAGRRLLVMTSAETYSVAPTTAYLVDITGPWR